MLSMTEKDTGKIKLSSLNSIVLVLSAYVLIALLIDTLFILPTEISRLLDLIDNLICIFFLLNFSFGSINQRINLNFSDGAG